MTRTRATSQASVDHLDVTKLKPQKESIGYLHPHIRSDAQKEFTMSPQKAESDKPTIVKTTKQKQKPNAKARVDVKSQRFQIKKKWHF
jgi:hypothetical protein